ncbi:MAG TPA: helix-turn-helix transcriptional regulator [Burkholderiaceae bacterium]|nr:helix-turn-helix transcriptional regulator [Burkholderiaceae bacterium]
MAASTTGRDDDAALDAVFFALASEPRRRVLDVLKAEPGCNVNRVAEHFGGEMTRFAVMKHLAVLEGAGLVIAEREGRAKRLWFNVVPIQWIHERWSSEYSAYWAARLTRLKRGAEGALVLPLTSAQRSKGGRHG